METRLNQSLTGQRKENGNIAEFTPVLFVLLVIFLFPMIDFMALGLTYTCGSMLNSAQLREAVLVKAQDARSSGGPVKKDVVDKWSTTGFGKFTKHGTIGTKVNYDLSVPTDPTSSVLVTVITTVPAEPMLNIPFPVKVTGLNDTVTFTYASQQLLEDPNSYNLKPNPSPPPKFLGPGAGGDHE